MAQQNSSAALSPDNPFAAPTPQPAQAAPADTQGSNPSSQAAPQSSGNPFAPVAPPSDMPGLSDDEAQRAHQLYDQRPLWRKVLFLAPAQAGLSDQDKQILQKAQPAAQQQMRAEVQQHDADLPTNASKLFGSVGSLAFAPEAAGSLASDAATGLGAGKGVALATKAAAQGVTAAGITKATGASNTASAVAGGLSAAVPLAGPAFEALGKGANAIRATFWADKATRATAQAVPDVNTILTATQNIADINKSVLPELQSRIGGVVDDAAREFGVDTTGTKAISAKMDAAGVGARDMAQELYGKLDDAAQQVTGQPGQFQTLFQNVNDARQSIYAAKTAAQAKSAQEALQGALTKFSAFKQQMIEAGIPEATIKQADTLWSRGMGLDDAAQKMLQNEDKFGNLKPSNAPLDTFIKSTSADAAKGGHKLAQALAGGADDVIAAAQQAHSQIESAKAARTAAQESVARTNAEAAAAQAKVNAAAANRKLAGQVVTAGSVLSGLGLGAKAVLSKQQGVK